MGIHLGAALVLLRTYIHAICSTQDFYTKKELLLPRDIHFKLYLKPENTSFTLDVEGRHLINIPYEFTFTFLSLSGKCPCRLPSVLCRCTEAVSGGQATAATSGGIIPIVGITAMFSKLNWTNIPWRLTAAYDTFRENFKSHKAIGPPSRLSPMHTLPQGNRQKLFYQKSYPLMARFCYQIIQCSLVRFIFYRRQFNIFRRRWCRSSNSHESYGQPNGPYARHVPVVQAAICQRRTEGNVDEASNIRGNA